MLIVLPARSIIVFFFKYGQWFSEFNNRIFFIINTSLGVKNNISNSRFSQGRMDGIDVWV